NVAPPAQGAQPPKPVRVTLSQFSGDRGSFSVDLLSTCDPKASVEKQPMDIPSFGVKSICLSIPPLPGEGKYTGSMVFGSDDAAPLVKPMAITRPQAALIVFPIAPRSIQLPFAGGFADQLP